MLDLLKLIWKTLISKPWLLPPIIIFIIISMIGVIAGNPTLAPFLYTLF